MRCGDFGEITYYVCCGDFGEITYYVINCGWGVEVDFGRILLGLP